jgi:nitrate reductase NapD
MTEDAHNQVLHISSAVVTARPEDCGDVARRIATLPDTEVRHIQGSKIIVLLEGLDAGAIGARLAEISLMDRVLSANLVFEQSAALTTLGDEPCR